MKFSQSGNTKAVTTERLKIVISEGNEKHEEDLCVMSLKDNGMIDNNTLWPQTLDMKQNTRPSL